ncbi:MAG: transposase [Lachnospiraceae bacterium]|nr:transposase [Lachnospiraceae bacterium]
MIHSGRRTIYDTEQAHEFRRRELISLRAENARLKKQSSGLFPDGEKAALERHIRHLEQVIRTNETRHESARSRLKLAEQIRHDLEIENLSLKEQVAALQAEAESLRSRAETAENEVRMLNGTNKKLEKKLNTSFRNSSLPSSALPFRKKVPNSRKPSCKKPGGRPGHEPHTASRLSPAREPVYLPPPDQFKNNPDIYPTGRTITKQLIDIQILVNVRDYTADVFRDRSTGARLHAPFPDGIVNDVNYGPSVKAFAFLLNNYYNVSIAKTKQCITDITKGSVSLSAGMICNLSSAFSAATEPDRANIFSLLTHADVLYSDATVSNVNGTRKTVTLCTDKMQVLYQHSDHKGHDGLSKTPVKNFRGTLVHDHDRTYYSYGSSHQECLAHVLRYLAGAMENEPHLTRHRQMHRLLQKMIHTAKKNKNGIPGDKIKNLTDNYESVLSIASEEYLKHPPGKEYMDGYNLYKRLREYQADYLYFLSHPDVDYTNNISERGLRKFKRKQKQAVVLRSDSGGQHICDALTIIETARMQHKNVYDTVESAFTK